MYVGPSEIILVLVVALLVLGPDKLPTAARQLGKAYRELRDISHSVRSQVEDALEIDEKNAKTATTPEEPAGPNPPNPDVSGFHFVDDHGVGSEGPRHARPAPDDPQLEPDPDAPGWTAR